MGAIRKWQKAMFILKWVILPFVVILIVGIFVAYMAGGELLEVYDSLTLKTADSKLNYDKKLFYVTTNEDGTKTITIGFQSEAQYEATQQAYKDIWEDGELGNEVTDNPSSAETEFTLTVEEESVKNALQGTYGSKATAMAMTYSYIVNTFNNPAMAVGLMANIACEGNADLVEKAFSQYHHWGFDLPDGDTTIKSMADIEYLLNWDSTTKTKCSASNCSGSGSHNWKKGSCGCGYIQWSGSRRITFLNKLKSFASTDDDLTEENFHLANCAMFQHELTPSTSYYTDTSALITESMKNSPEAWAEALCEEYIKPGGRCTSMNGSGTSCAQRRQQATTIASLLEGINE